MKNFPKVIYKTFLNYTKNFYSYNFFWKKAARNGNLEAVKMLIEQGADIETKYYNGYTPLYWGAYLLVLQLFKLIN